jgi:hypothetical protein
MKGKILKPIIIIIIIRTTAVTPHIAISASSDSDRL